MDLLEQTTAGRTPRDESLRIMHLKNMSSKYTIRLTHQASGGILGCMRNGGKQARRKRAEFVGQPNALGAVLADLRTAKGHSLREVEEATGKAVSNAYLSQLENGRIQKPSPNVLHSLAEVYAVPYETLMEKAGYLLPSEERGGRRRRLAAFAIDDLTAEEEEELLKYLAFLRSRSPS
jgi:transcriptional regulator with XRE-family HTH domain